MPVVTGKVFSTSEHVGEGKVKEGVSGSVYVSVPINTVVVKYDVE